MKIFIVYRITKEGTMFEISEDGQYKKMQSEELPTYISDLVHKVRQSTFVYVRGLNEMKSDFVKSLYLADVNFIEGNPKDSDMKPLDCKSLIGGDIPKIFHLTVSNHNKKICFMDLDNFLPDCEKVIKSWGKHEEIAYVKAYERAMSDLERICKISRKKPYTISGAARRLMKKVMPDFQPENITKLCIKEEGDLDEFVRNTYRGGLCIYHNRDYIEHEGPGICLDVHSMYPDIMIRKKLPYQNPCYYKGEPSEEIFKKAENEELAVFIHIKAQFKIKPDGVPCVRSEDITTKQGWLENSNIYDVSSGKEIEKNRQIDLYLTYMDYKDFMDNYDVKSIRYIDYVTMETADKGLFMPLVRPLYKAKRNSKGGYQKMVKIVLNSVSGTVAMRSEYENYMIRISEDGDVDFELCKTSIAKSYIYMGAYITSWARHILIAIIKAHRNRWIYSDTDCVFLRGVDIPDDVEIGEGIGRWAVDKRFDDLVIYKQKMYGYKINGEYHFTIAGMRESDVQGIPEIKSYKNDKYLHGDMYIKGNKMYGTAIRRDRIKEILEAEYGAKITDGIFWDAIERPEEIDDRYLNLEKEYNDRSAEIELYKAECGDIDLLDAVMCCPLHMTGYKFIDFELYSWDYSMEIRDFETYA